MRAGFTLVELLVVVGIISILAAIALPNFQLAKTRATISSTAAGLRVIRGGIEQYQVDAGGYPRNTWRDSPYFDGSWLELPSAVTTPIAYLAPSNLVDPFTGDSPNSNRFHFRAYTYVNPGTLRHLWLHQPPGFDANYQVITSLPVIDAISADCGHWATASLGPDRYTPDPELAEFWIVYDPTNGTLSAGNMFTSQRGTVESQLLVGRAYPTP